MGLLKDWRDHAYGLDDRTPEGKQFWLTYFQMEKGIYEELLEDPTQVVTCTVKELAEKYNTTIELITGFLDGIDDSLKESNNLDDITEDSEITLDIDTEKLYMNMVNCNAEWLYTLPQWDAIYDKETSRKDNKYLIDVGTGRRLVRGTLFGGKSRDNRSYKGSCYGRRSERHNRQLYCAGSYSYRNEFSSFRAGYIRTQR